MVVVGAGPGSLLPGMNPLSRVKIEVNRLMMNCKMELAIVVLPCRCSCVFLRFCCVYSVVFTVTFYKRYRNVA